jgi:hypothetical protein
MPEASSRCKSTAPIRLIASQREGYVRDLGILLDYRREITSTRQLAKHL